MKILRNGMAGTLIALVPATATLAETRPNAAVPMASSAAVAAQYSDDDDDGGMPWLAIGAIGIAVLVALYIIIDGDDDGEGAISRA